jgi:hypothetical protein
MRKLTVHVWAPSVHTAIFVKYEPCSVLVEFGVPMKLVRLTKMCLNETGSKIHIGKHLFDTFPIENGLKGDAL